MGKCKHFLSLYTGVGGSTLSAADDDKLVVFLAEPESDGAGKWRYVPYSLYIYDEAADLVLQEIDNG